MPQRTMRSIYFSSNSTEIIGAQTDGAKSIVSNGVVRWVSRWPQITLVLLTLLCLVPFADKAIHIDDPIFIWTAQHITKHPLDPYGFSVMGYWHPMPMWQIQQNPPLASYYMAMVASIGGWSERALHLGFILPALAVILGTYHLALRFTKKPLLAAAATLLTPGFLVSATGLMCDPMMLAIWVLAIVFWVKGLEEQLRPLYLITSGVLIAASTLTKYFGVALIPLLLAYSLARQRSSRGWIGYLAIPVVILGAYEFYTHQLYGYGLISQAIQHKAAVRGLEGRSARTLVGLAFTGGCALTALTFVPLLWSRKQIAWGGILSALLGVFFFRGWVNLGTIYAHERWLYEHRFSISVQLMFYVAGGISLLALASADLWQRKDAASLLLFLWVVGTVFFTIVVNWSVNARSVLPLIPAIGILIARRLDTIRVGGARWQWLALAVPLIVSGAVSLWATAGDAALANAPRMAAKYIQEKTRDDSSTVRFEGRWGLQYYMEAFGARPLEPGVYDCKFGDLIVIPTYSTSIFPFRLKTTAVQVIDFEIHSWITTMNPDAGAGFYFSGWGPLPFVIGPVPVQHYSTARLVQTR